MTNIIITINKMVRIAAYVAAIILLLVTANELLAGIILAAIVVLTWIVDGFFVFMNEDEALDIDAVLNRLSMWIKGLLAAGISLVVCGVAYCLATIAVWISRAATIVATSAKRAYNYIRSKFSATTE